MTAKQDAAKKPLHIRPPKGLVPLDLGELWRARETLFFLTLRDIKIRYTQSFLGLAWVIGQPLMTLLVFYFVFSVLLGGRALPTPKGIPYVLSTYAALVAWGYFARAVTKACHSFAAQRQLLTKVYVPRIIIPLAPICAAILDFLVAILLLVPLFAFYGLSPGREILVLPGVLLLTLFFALTLSLWLAPLNALYRDIGHGISFILQVAMYLTPVIYDSQSLLSALPPRWHDLYRFNPMVGVMELYRWSLFGTPLGDFGPCLWGFGAMALVFVAGLFFFRAMQRHLADWV